MSTASAKKTASWNAGQVIAGKFRLLRELGRGGMGAVWEAEHMALGSSVAIKLIEPHAAESTIGVVRFVREAKASAALRSPHVVQTLDHGLDGATPYIVMEMLEGESLDERLTRKTRLSNEETARVVTHISRALTKAAEQGIVHRDLKPANIFVVDNLDDEVVKVLDFGIAKQSINEQGGSAVETKTGTLVGTPLYMSPEQTRGKTLDHRSDLWSLAMIAYECHVGSRPFSGPALGELILQICTLPLPVPSEHVEVANGFDAWFAKAASRDIEERYQTATELAGALRAVLLADGVGNPITLTTGERQLVQPAAATELQTEAGLGTTIGTAKAGKNGGWLVAVGAAVVAAGGYLWWTAARGPEAARETAEQASTAALSASSRETAHAEEARVTVRPATARVTVDGKPATLDDGELVLHGPLGSVHRVAVVHGELEGDFRVVLTELGPQPDSIVLDASEHPAIEASAKPTASATRPSAPAHTAARPHATPPPAAPPPAPPPKKGTAAPPPPAKPAQPTPPPDGPAMKPTFE